MTKTKLFAIAAVLSSVIATPVLARDINRSAMNRVDVTPQQTYDNSYDRRVDSGFWPADAAAGIVGGAIGTAGAIATAPFRAGDAYAYNNGAYDNGAYDPRFSQSYAARNGFVCEPGTFFRGEDGRRHLCQ